MASQMFLDSRNRAYQRAKRSLEANGQYVVNDEAKARKDTKMNLRVAQSNLVSICPLATTSTSYVFNTLDNIPNAGNGGIRPLERRLKQQDVFFTSSLGFFLTAFIAGTWQPIHYQFWTYPPPALSGNFGVGDMQALMGLWTTGNLEVKVNGETLTPNWWLQKHMKISQTETPWGGWPLNPAWDQHDYSEDGYQVVEPNWIVNGGNNNLYTVTYGPDYGDIWTGNPALTIQLGIAMVWDGWLAQNASSIMNNAPMKP